VTDSQTSPEPAGRYRLATFGTLALSGSGGDTVLGGHGHHRRRLALLAVLAAAGDRGRSRDQLLLLFWPEASQTRARHSLDQLLYALRSSIGETVFAGVNPVRLNPDVIGSDVAVFNTALERGDFQAAAETYRGPFLDSFYLSESPEFERWVESERSRLAGSYAAALDRLARRADAAGDHEAAARWWHALTEHDPLSSRNAAGRIRSLVNAGDQPAALQFARRYEALVARELGTGVDATLAALMNELRARPRIERATSSETPPRMLRPEDSAGVDIAVATLEVPPLAAEAPPPSAADRPTRRPRALYLAASLLATSVVVAMIWRARTHERDAVAIRSDIAGAVTRELDHRLAAGTLARRQRGSTHNVAAHELYVRGSDPARFRSDSGARAGLELLQQAVALDPRYAAAYASMALLHLRVSGSPGVVSHRARLELAERAALQAVSLDDSLADGHASLSIVREVNLDLRSAETEMQRAVALDPTNARLREYMSQLYVTTEQPDLALKEARRALELDPLSPTANAEVAHALLASDRCDEALALLATLQPLRPPLLRAGSLAAQCYTRKRMWPEAIAEARRISVAGGARGQSILGYVLGRAGHTKEARAIAASLTDRARQKEGGAFDVAMVYAGLGDNDQAFAWLDRAIEERSVSLRHHHDLVRSLAPDPRFDRFRARLGLSKRRV
jgi:DNA-binding SARP family transcriptional activator